MGSVRSRGGSVGGATVLVAVLALLVAGCGGGGPLDTSSPVAPVGPERAPSIAPSGPGGRDGRISARFVADGPFTDLAPDLTAAPFELDVEGAPASAACVEKWELFDPLPRQLAKEPGEVGLADADVRRAAWIATHHGSVGTPLAEPDESGALQGALWIAVGDLTPADVTDPSLRGRVDELLAASAGQEAELPPVRVQLTATTADDGTVTVALTGDGEPMAGEPLTVSGDGWSVDATTGPDGTAPVDVPAGAAGEARWTGTIPPGLVVETEAGDSQALMTTTPVELVRTAPVVPSDAGVVDA